MIMERQLTIYVSGPMTGYEDYNHPEFNRISAKLEKSGYFGKVINPASMDEGEKPWSYYLRRDLKIIMDNDVEALVLLPGWKLSKGAQVEVYVATEVLGADLYLYQDTPDGFNLVPLELPEVEVIEGTVRTDKTMSIIVEED